MIKVYDERVQDWPHARGILRVGRTCSADVSM